MALSMSGAGRTASGASSITSLTESTTMPTTRLRRFRMMTTVKLLYSTWEQLNFSRMSTMGTMVPRRLTTPLMNSGALAIRVGGS
jgi:hypothetical protein